MVPIEVKNAWHDAAKVWDTEVPLAYQVQIQAQMAVLDAPMGYFACWLHRGGPPVFRLHPIYRDDLVIERIFEAAHKFRKQVVDGIPPEVDGSAVTQAALASQYVDTSDEEIALDAEWEVKRNAIAELEDEAARIEEQVQLYKNEFRDVLGAATVGRLPSGKRVTWKPNKNGTRSLRV